MDFPIWDFCRTCYTKLAKFFGLHTASRIFSTLPITNSTAKVIAHRIIVPKQNNTRLFPFAVHHNVLVLRGCLTIRLLFTTLIWLHLNLECQVAVVAKFCMVAPDVCWSLEWNFLQCHPSGILIFWQICAPLVWLYIITPKIYYYFMFTAVLVYNFVNNANVSSRSETPF
jgi:hypothetical protein